MATITATVARAMQATYMPSTTVTKIQSYVTSASLSAGDVIMFQNIRIPHGAIVHSVATKGSAVDGTFLFEIGTQGSGGTIDLFGSKTYSFGGVVALTQLAVGLPATISVSDDSVDRFQTFAVRVDGATTSGTSSTSIQFIVQYYCP